MRQAQDSQGRLGFSVWRLRAQVRSVASRGLAAERGDGSVRSVASSEYRGEGRDRRRLPGANTVHPRHRIVDDGAAAVDAVSSKADATARRKTRLTPRTIV